MLTPGVFVANAVNWAQRSAGAVPATGYWAVICADNAVTAADVNCPFNALCCFALSLLPEIVPAVVFNAVIEVEIPFEISPVLELIAAKA